MTAERYDYTRIPASGREFEQYVASVFADLGYVVELTPASGDYGADVILTEPGSARRIAVQAKFYGSALDNTPVQEVVGSLAHYGAMEGWVVTNSTFSRGAWRLADENGVRLIEGSELRELVSAAMENRALAEAGGQGATQTWRDLDFRGLDAMAEETTLLEDGAAGADAVRPAGQTTLLPGESNGRDGRTSVMAQGGPADGRGSQADARVSRTMPFPAVVGAPVGYAGGAARAEGTYAQAGEPVYSLSELAGLWGVSPNRIRRMITEEGMPMRRTPGGRWEIGASELAAWTAEHDARVSAQAARDGRRERRRRVRRVVGTLIGWAVALALVVCAVVIVRSLADVLAPGSLDAAVAQLTDAVRSALADGAAATA